MATNNVVTGVVEEVSSRVGAYGTMYSIKVDGTWYGAGNIKPGEKGDTLKFSAYKNGQYWNAKQFEKVEGGTPTQAVTTAPEARSAPVAEQPTETAKPTTTAAPIRQEYNKPFDERQSSIVFQSSRNTALELVKLLVANEAAGFTKADKGKDKHEKIIALHDDLTTRLYHQAMDHINFVGKAPPKAVVDSEEDNDE